MALVLAAIALITVGAIVGGVVGGRKLGGNATRYTASVSNEKRCKVLETLTLLM